ncbi:MAG: xylulokinase [bacterium]|jgi:xylulokinase|nr:xylulokinase [bacterium]
MSDKKLLLGIDLGTSGCKITLIDQRGQVVAEDMEEIKSRHLYPGWSEQAPEEWYNATCKVLQRMRRYSAWQADKIAGIALDGSTHNAVLLDREFKVLRPVIMWTDQRSVEEAAWLENNYGERIFQTAYQRPSPTWTLPQLLWIQKHEPEVLSKTAHIMFAKDYLRYRLTGTWETDYIEAQGTLFYDMKAQAWSEELCGYAGISLEALPPLVKPTDIVGKVTEEASRITGLPTGVPVAAGCSDSAVEDYAAGAVKPGQCIIKLATAGNVNVMTDIPYPHQQTLTYSHVIPGLWYTVVATNTAASAKRWFRELFCAEEVEAARQQNKSPYEIMDARAAQVAAGSEGLFFHPYLLGERAPYWDPHLRASFTGASMLHDKGHFLRAILEGVAYSIRDCYGVLEDMKLPVNEIRLIGGGARSKLWCRIVSDILGREILVPAVGDASFGAALLAGVGVGVFRNEEEAIERCVKIADSFKPDHDAHEKYSKMFGTYRRICSSLMDIYRQSV